MVIPATDPLEARAQPSPLAGIRVLDLTTVLAGPYCTYQLALLGAEVIKLERPGTGDWARQGARVQGLPEFSAQFVAQNAGKKSIELDLKQADGLAQALALVKTCDILVENFSPGVADRLGIGFKSVRKGSSPDIVYCALWLRPGGGHEPGGVRPRRSGSVRHHHAHGDARNGAQPHRSAHDRLPGGHLRRVCGDGWAKESATGPGSPSFWTLPCWTPPSSQWRRRCRSTPMLLSVANGNTAASGSPMSGIFKTREGLQ